MPQQNDIEPPPDRVDLGPELNHLLNRNTRLGEGEGKPSGLELPSPGTRGGEMNIVLLAGRPGSGKSTLAFQIAAQAAAQGFDSLYISLEDHPKSAIKKAKQFQWDRYVYLPKMPPPDGQDADAVFDSILDSARQAVEENPGSWGKWKEWIKSQQIGPVEKWPRGAIIAASLLPRPVSTKTERTKDFFLEQYQYLETLVRSSARHAASNRESHFGIRIVVIDSLSMLSYSGQTRESLYRVFDLFRANGIMGVFTADADYQASADGDRPALLFDSTMADVVFSFSSKLDAAYLVRYLSIEKSRYTPTSYGLHPYKFNVPGGIRVLPSLHAIIAATQKKPSQKKGRFPFGWGEDLTRYVVRTNLQRPGVVALHGPHGSRKSTIALNFLIHGLIGYESGSPPGESGILIRLKDDTGDSIEFQNLPTYPELNAGLQSKLKLCQKGDLVTQLDTVFGNSTKAGVQVWGVEGRDDQAVLVVVDFNTGMVLPEEFVDIITCIYEKVDRKGNEKQPGRLIRRVVLDDISIIGGVSYPLLEKSETTADLFLSGFVHVMRNRQVDLMLVGTRGHLESGNKIVDKAVALADAVVETKIRDIFGDRYVLLAGDGVMAQEETHKEYVPPALQEISIAGRQHIKFDLELLCGLTGFDGPVITRTKVYAFLFALNDLHRRYNNTLPFLVEPLCGLPVNDDGGDHCGPASAVPGFSRIFERSGGNNSGLQVIHFDPDISDTIHRSLGVPGDAGTPSAQKLHPPKEHTVLATIDEFERELKQDPSAENYTKNVLVVAWRDGLVDLPPLPPNTEPSRVWGSWRILFEHVEKAKSPEAFNANDQSLRGRVWVDRSVRETLSCCLLDCLISGWKSGNATNSSEFNDAILEAILNTLKQETPESEGQNRIVHETAALNGVFQIVKQDFPQKWRHYSSLWPDSKDGKTDCLPVNAAVYICWYSQLRELLDRPEYMSKAEEFRVAALPGGGFKGDWTLLVLPGSVSHGLGDEVVKTLVSPEEDYRRFVLGIGLPAREKWKTNEFRAWPGAVESQTLKFMYDIHEKANERSKITNYAKFARLLSTFAQRLAGDWDNQVGDKKMNGDFFKKHLARLWEHVDFLKKMDSKT